MAATPVTETPGDDWTVVRSRRGHHNHNRRLRRSLAITDPGTSGAPPPPQGLDSSVIASIPIITISSTARDCAVCLAELEQGDEARALPRCGHCFHVQCIDTWFRSHATCPLCRGDVELGFGVEDMVVAAAGKETETETETDEGRMVIMGRILSGDYRTNGSDPELVNGALDASEEPGFAAVGAV